MPASIFEEVDHPLGAASTPRAMIRSHRPARPSRGSVHAARILGDNGGVLRGHTARGHSWS